MAKGQDIAEKNLYDLANLVDYDFTNKVLSMADKDIGEISKKTIQNIAKWSLNGADESEIRNNLELSPKQFKILCQACPVVVQAMLMGQEYANILVSSSLLQRAIGGQMVSREVLVKVTEYNDEGFKCGEHYEKHVLKEELPPEPGLLKFLATNKLGEKFGKDKVDSDAKMRNFVGELDETQTKELEKVMLKDFK